MSEVSKLDRRFPQVTYLNVCLFPGYHHLCFLQRSPITVGDCQGSWVTHIWPVIAWQADRHGVMTKIYPSRWYRRLHVGLVLNSRSCLVLFSTYVRNHSTPSECNIQRCSWEHKVAMAFEPLHFLAQLQQKIVCFLKSRVQMPEMVQSCRSTPFPAS